jgi:hypothetical protein
VGILSGWSKDKLDSLFYTNLQYECKWNVLSAHTSIMWIRVNSLVSQLPNKRFALFSPRMHCLWKVTFLCFEWVFFCFK